MNESEDKPTPGRVPPPLPPDESVDREWADRLKVPCNPVRPVPPPLPETPQPGGASPASPIAPIRPSMPPAYLLLSLLSLLLCCLIPGIVALWYSTRVSSRYWAADYDGAARASRRAEIWIIASVVCGVLWNTLSFPLGLLF